MHLWQRAAPRCNVRRGRYKVAHLRRLKALWDEKESLDRQRVRRAARLHVQDTWALTRWPGQGRGRVDWHGCTRDGGATVRAPQPSPPN